MYSLLITDNSAKKSIQTEQISSEISENILSSYKTIAHFSPKIMQVVKNNHTILALLLHLPRLYEKVLDCTGNQRSF
jgi:hypothetical protein